MTTTGRQVVEIPPFAWSGNRPKAAYENVYETQGVHNAAYHGREAPAVGGLKFRGEVVDAAACQR